VRRLVAAILVFVEPLALALSSSAALEWILTRGPLAIAFLLVRLTITGIGMVGGIRIQDDRPGGFMLARWSFAGQLAATLVAHGIRVWPTTLAPGLAEPAFALGVGWYSAWLTWTLLAGDERHP
jgi:hypothetical protein